MHLHSIVRLALQSPMANRVPQLARHSLLLLLLLLTSIRVLPTILRQTNPLPRLDKLVGKAAKLGASANGRGSDAWHSSEEDLGLDGDGFVEDAVQSWIEGLESSVVVFSFARRESEPIPKLLGKLESLLLLGESGEAQSVNL